MKNIVKYVYFLLVIAFLSYLAIPAPKFPDPPANSLISKEPADTESSLRKAYFTNSNRSEVIEHYKKEFTRSSSMGINLITYKLNYPPEEAQVLIRDQTRSSYLEEIVHPFRESLFINGFIPESQKDTIIIEDKHWEQKIIIKYVPSNIFVRLAVGLFTSIAGWVLMKKFINTVFIIRSDIRKIKWTSQ